MAQVFPSNTSDLMELLRGRRVSRTLTVGTHGTGNLLHQTIVLQNIERFLLSLPVLCAYHHKIVTTTSRKP